MKHLELYEGFMSNLFKGKKKKEELSTDDIIKKIKDIIKNQKIELVFRILSRTDDNPSIYLSFNDGSSNSESGTIIELNSSISGFDAAMEQIGKLSGVEVNTDKYGKSYTFEIDDELANIIKNKKYEFALVEYSALVDEKDDYETFSTFEELKNSYYGDGSLYKYEKELAKHNAKHNAENDLKVKKEEQIRKNKNAANTGYVKTFDEIQKDKEDKEDNNFDVLTAYGDAMGI